MNKLTKVLQKGRIRSLSLVVVALFMSVLVVQANQTKPVAAEPIGSCVNNTYKVGDSSGCVKLMQQMLGFVSWQLGFPTPPVDGVFSAQNQDIIKAMQQKHGQTNVAGSVDAATWVNLCLRTHIYYNSPGRPDAKYTMAFAGCTVY